MDAYGYCVGLFITICDIETDRIPEGKLLNSTIRSGCQILDNRSLK